VGRSDTEEIVTSHDSMEAKRSECLIYEKGYFMHLTHFALQSKDIQMHCWGGAATWTNHSIEMFHNKDRACILLSECIAEIAMRILRGRSDIGNGGTFHGFNVGIIPAVCSG
jgi:hypothetical protein